MAGISSNTLKATYSSNRKQFNGIEHTTELDINTYDAFFRNADPQTGRWWQIDPKPNIVESPYSMMGNNPIRESDPLGDTLFVNKYGSVIRNTGTDNFVYQETKNGNKLIGELGKRINTKEITKNLRELNKSLAKTMKALPGEGVTTAVWANTVKQDAPWDYKNNKKTIFGVAWAFDQAQKEKTGKDVQTMFTVSTGNGKSALMNAADFGNFNAGYTGTIAGISKELQLIGAGAVEMKKNHDWMGMFGQAIAPTFPFGDQIRDAGFNMLGMKVAEEEKNDKP